MAKKNKTMKKAGKRPTMKKKPGKSRGAGRASEENSFKLKPLQDRVIIKEDTESKERQTATGIIIPISATEDKGSKRGIVVAVGPGRTDDGVVIPIALDIGDKVLFQWGDKVKVDDEEYYLVRESEILAVVK